MRLSEIYGEMSERNENEVFDSRVSEPKGRSPYQKNAKTTPISFEIFPPKGENKQEKIEALIFEMEKLKEHNPSLISITYGAGGGNRECTIDIAKKIKDKLEINPMQHFTCICSSREYIRNYLKEIEALGIENILALKGDEPRNNEVCYQDFKYANELVDFIRQNSNLEIGVAGYPEKHPESLTLDDDIRNLKRKIQSGGSAIFTQLFFDNEKFYSYCDKIRAIGIDVPVIAGILPVTAFSQLSRMGDMCGVKLPRVMVEKFEKFKNNEDDTIKMGIEFATIQCQKLMEFGVSGLHFYTLNKAHSTNCVIQNLF